MELKKEVESLLFSSGKVMSEKELAELTNSSEKDVRLALETLKKEYDERDTSLMLVQSGDKWKLNVREKYMNLVTKIVADTELPFPVLETLAVIAYKAPVIQAEVIKIRGTNAYEHIGMLVKEEFVEKRKEGRSFRLGLTPKFFKYFEVDDENKIKEALKEVRVPEKKTPKKIGKLDVVDIPLGEAKKTEREDKSKLGDLEVVDVSPQEGKERISIENNKPDEDFLRRIDERLEEIRARNDELHKDEVFRRQSERMEEMEVEREGVLEQGCEEKEKEEVEEQKVKEDEQETKEELVEEVPEENEVGGEADKEKSEEPEGKLGEEEKK